MPTTAAPIPAGRAKRRNNRSIAFFDPAPLEGLTGSAEARILDAGRRCILRYSSARLSMNDVARMAGVSRRTVYNHYADRDALLRAVEELMIQCVADDLDRSMASCTGLDQQVAAAALCLLRVRDAELAVGMYTEEEKGKVIIAQADFILPPMMTVIGTYIAEARAGGELRADLNIDEAAEWVTRMVVSLTLIKPQTFNVNRPSEVTRFITTYLIRGLS